KDFTALENVIPGSRVAFTFESNNPVLELHGSNGKGQPVTAKKPAQTRWQIESEIVANETLQLDYRDGDALAGNDSLKLRTLADEPPKIAITEPVEGRELLAARDGSLAVRFTATDDFGL